MAPPITRLSIRIINKGRSDKHGFPFREMRVFADRPDGTADRLGTISASWGRVTLLRKIIEEGCRALRVPCSITEPKSAAAELG